MNKQHSPRAKKDKTFKLVKTADREPKKLPGSTIQNEGSWREMHSRYGLLLRMFFKRFFTPIRFSTFQEKRLKEAAEQGGLIYVMESSSHLHYLFLNFWCLRFRLPLASYGNGIPSFFLFQPAEKFFQFLRRKIASLRSEPWNLRQEPFTTYCERQLQEGRAMVLFLHRNRRLGKRSYQEAKEFLDILMTCQRKSEQPLFFVPLAILWGKRPDKMEKSILDILLGEKEAPGVLRQILILLPQISYHRPNTTQWHLPFLSHFPTKRQQPCTGQSNPRFSILYARRLPANPSTPMGQY